MNRPSLPDRFGRRFSGRATAGACSVLTLLSVTALSDRVAVFADPGRHALAPAPRADGSAACAKVRFYAGPDNPLAEFAKRPLQGWLYVYGNPGEAARLNWDAAPIEARSPRPGAAQARRPINVYFEVEVPAYRSATRHGAAHFSHTARFHWSLPTAVGFDSASGPFFRPAGAAAPSAEPAPTRRGQPS